jgi:hypothetical protein
MASYQQHQGEAALRLRLWRGPHCRAAADNAHGQQHQTRRRHLWADVMARAAWLLFRRAASGQRLRAVIAYAFRAHCMRASASFFAPRGAAALLSPAIF